MIEYKMPEINIIKFSTENIATTSSVFNGMVEESTTQVETVTYGQVLETN